MCALSIGKSIRQLTLGESFQQVYIITEQVCSAYADITGDYNPLHFDTYYAQNSHFKGKIAHGMLLAGYVSSIIGTKLPGPGCLYENQYYEFLKPVYFGDEITVIVEVAEINADRNRVKLLTKCINQDANIVLTGYATVLPRKE